jgi:hypothetical protein
VVNNNFLMAAENRVLELDGNESWVELPADLLKNVKKELTVEGWIRWERLGYFSRFFDFGPQKALAISQVEDSTSLGVRLHEAGLPLPRFLRVPSLLSTNQWYHLALTISERDAKLYVNGVLTASDRFLLDLDPARAGPLRLGASIHSEDQQGRRQIDEFRVWSVTRTEDQIRQAMWLKLTGRETGLLGCWTFDAGDATDLTPIQRHGSPRGTPRYPAHASPQLADVLMPAQIEGVLRDANGQPRSGLVTLKGTGALSQDNLLLGVSPGFRFTVFNPGNDVFELTAEAAGRTVVSGGILLTNGYTLRRDLRQDDPGSISGTLRTFDPGVFHAVVPVQLINASNQVVATVLSDGSGRYAFTNLPPAEYQVRCQVLSGYRYLGVTNLVRHADVASASAASPGAPASVPVRNSPAERPALSAALRGAERINLIAGQKTEDADFAFAPFKKGYWRTYSERDGLASKEVQKVLPLDNGTLWIATMGGLSIFDGARFKTLRKEDGLPDSRILNLHREPSGAIWICTANGVARFDPLSPTGKQIQSYTAADGLIPGRIVGVCQTPDGAMWFGGDGLSKFQAGKIMNIPMTNLLVAATQGLAASSDGVVWLGTYGNGLLRFDGTNFTAIAPEKKFFGALTRSSVRTELFGSARMDFGVTTRRQRQTATGDCSGIGVERACLKAMFTPPTSPQMAPCGLATRSPVSLATMGPVS